MENSTNNQIPLRRLDYKKTVTSILLFPPDCSEKSQLSYCELPFGWTNMAKDWGRPPAQKKLRPSVQYPPGTESCQEPHEQAWKQIFPQSSFQMRLEPQWQIACNLIVTSTQISCTQVSEIINVSSFKPLISGVVCYATINRTVQFNSRIL